MAYPRNKIRYLPYRSKDSGSKPEVRDMADREFAVNTHDKQIYVRINDELVTPNTIAEFIDLILPIDVKLVEQPTMLNDKELIDKELIVRGFMFVLGIITGIFIVQFIWN